MDCEGIDYMSQLLAIGEGGEAFFVSCLLHLSPEDLKACRLVNKTWNDLIKERVWGNKRARKTLEEKLLNRWKTTNPETVQLGTVPRGVLAMFCNNSHVFLGWGNSEVKVYSMTDGQWARDLESGEENLWVERICGGESIVAAQLGTDVVRVWSSKEEMGRLHSFDVRNHEGNAMARRDLVRDIKVTGNKVVILLQDGPLWTTHKLVVLQEGEHNKILDPFTTPRWNIRLAVDGDWWAVAGGDVSRPDILMVKLWKEDLFKRDIELPGVRARDVQDVVLESPFLVVGVTSWSAATRPIKVFQLAANNLMEDLNTAASLVKTLQFPNLYFDKLRCTGLVLGCQMRAQGQRSLVLFEKTALLDTTTLPEQTPGNRVHLGTIGFNLVDMNTTSLVFIQNVTGQENNLCKKDFWISRTTVA